MWSKSWSLVSSGGGINGVPAPLLRHAGHAPPLPARSSPARFAAASAVERTGRLRRVAIAATYPEDVSACFEDFLEAAGIEVVRTGHQDILTAEEVGGLGHDRVLRMIRENDDPRAQAVLVPDTALHSAAWLEELDAIAGKPVLTANQVSFWKALRLAGDSNPRDGLGALLRAAA